MIEWVLIGGILLAASGGKSTPGLKLVSNGDEVALSDSKIALDATLSAKQKKIFLAVDTMIKNSINGDHCWDWVYRVFKMAGYGGTASNKVADFNFIFIGNQYQNTYKLRTISSSNFYPTSHLVSLQPGDWLYIHNRNSADAKGNHSVIFLGWRDFSNKIAKAASSPWSNTPGEYKDRDLKNNPVAHLMRVKDYA